MSDLRALLNTFRDAAKSEREKGSYFERIVIEFLKNDPGMAQEYEDAVLFSDWARAEARDARDTGIDVVAKMRDGGWCAIQCKFYRAGHRIQKADIDSFFTASGKSPFTRRLIIDTTDAPWGDNAEAALDGQQIETTRIGLDRLSASPIDWATYLREEKVVLSAKKQPRPHQADAVAAVRDGLACADRGKLIMACGTGKTFTGLKIAEDLVGPGGAVLFLVPSLALMSQTIREWTLDADAPLASFAVCSDAQVGKRRRDTDDVAEVAAHDLDYPATTNARKLAAKAERVDPARMTVVFATYQSLPVVAEAQASYGLGPFDLIICDEAHRTTGATLAGEDESNFVRVHDAAYIAGRKRLYMTATPRVFGDAVKSKANDASAVLCSMDDPALYGETLFERGFGWAVENRLLTDYKVLVLAVDEQLVGAGVQRRLADDSSELKLDDATKIIGCYKALTKQGLRPELLSDPQPMRRALAFCRDIATSKLVQQEFAAVVSEYLASEEGQASEGDVAPLACQLEHVDGTFNAKARTQLLDWLKEEHDDNACRILSNARCLAEGVDVPALDAILFMHPRKSQIDVVQSVGRVMRRAPGKNMGYVILPVGVPAGMAPEDALNDNERYRVVWQILNALRSHDERFDAMINKVDLGVDVSDHIEVIAVSNTLPERKDAKTKRPNIGHGSAPGDDDAGGGDPKTRPPTQTEFIFDEFSKAVMAKIVRKCGRRDYWEDWASDIARIAEAHISRITALVAKPGTSERAAFESFLREIRDDLNDSISDAEATEMLAQHLITRPVFDALFEGYSFADANPVSVALQKVLDALDEHNLEKESGSLEVFYESVRRRAAGIDSAAAKQKIVVELYDKFFRNAFPRMTERLGIVYTPVEVVDFIIRSVDEVLRAEFDQTVGSKGVHILDPFTGTGTFITRLLQSGLIRPEELEHKYRHEIHANEIVLLAYYIAAINIEAAYHGAVGGDYLPFEGICLTDTFQLHEQEADLVSELMADNSTRRTRQKELDIRVIVGNPPYSVGQKSENDNADNLVYPRLDGRIRDTYAKRSKATLSKGLYDSYIRAIRWASDRVGDAGIVAYVSNGGWIDTNTFDGMRKCLADEFTRIHVFHLRGNQRTSGERSRREGGKIFGGGSRTPVAITLLVKNPASSEQGRVFFHDIGDYLSREEKLGTIARFGSIGGIEAAGAWQPITPDAHGDWLGQRDDGFDAFIALGDKKTNQPKLFKNFSLGVITNRDAWAYNASPTALAQNMSAMIDTYETERARFAAQHPDADRKRREGLVDGFINPDPKKISWTRALKGDLVRDKALAYESAAATQGLYRPFTRQWLYYNRAFNEVVYQMPRIYPIGRADVENRVISIPAPGNVTPFSTLMSNTLLDLSVTAAKAGTQCFPRFLYDGDEPLAAGAQGDLLAAAEERASRRDGITDVGLAHFRSQYPGETITKDDLFYYVYGLFHSEDYRTRYADNFSKELPRIPAVSTAADFWAFVKAGRQLGDLHCEYEGADPYPVVFERGGTDLVAPSDPERFFRVEQMRFAGKRPKLDKTTIVYNANITITGVPREAHDYVVNGKSAIEWVMERQVVKTDKASGIVNDFNAYATETMKDPAYPLILLLKVITVSLETMKIVRELPPLVIADGRVTGSARSAHAPEPVL